MAIRINNRGEVTASGAFTAPVPNLACVETIGPCEDCGVVDHHLVLGLCASCEGRYTPNPTTKQENGA